MRLNLELLKVYTGDVEGRQGDGHRPWVWRVCLYLQCKDRNDG